MPQFVLAYALRSLSYAPKGLVFALTMPLHYLGPYTLASAFSSLTYASRVLVYAPKSLAYPPCMPSEVSPPPPRKFGLCPQKFGLCPRMIGLCPRYLVVCP